MDVDEEEEKANSINNNVKVNECSVHITELENVENMISKLLTTAYHTSIALSKMDEIEKNHLQNLIRNYHSLLSNIETELRKQINQCNEALLLPILPIGHAQQYISEMNGRDVHRKILKKDANQTK